MGLINGEQRGQSIDIRNCIVFLKTLALDTGNLVFMAIKIGDGQLSFTESQAFTPILNRGKLDDIRSGDQQQVALNINGRATFFLSNIEGPAQDETYTANEILRGIEYGNIDDHGRPKFRGTREDWLTAYGCPPYCADVEIHNNPGLACPDTEAVGEAMLFRYFRVESINPDLSAGNVSISGNCHITQPMLARVAAFGGVQPAQAGSGIFSYNDERLAEPMDANGTFWAADPRSLLHPYNT